MTKSKTANHHLAFVHTKTPLGQALLESARHRGLRFISIEFAPSALLLTDQDGHTTKLEQKGLPDDLGLVADLALISTLVDAGGPYLTENGLPSSLRPVPRVKPEVDREDESRFLAKNLSDTVASLALASRLPALQKYIASSSLKIGHLLPKDKDKQLVASSIPKSPKPCTNPLALAAYARENLLTSKRPSQWRASNAERHIVRLGILAGAPVNGEASLGLRSTLALAANSWFQLFAKWAPLVPMPFQDHGRLFLTNIHRAADYLLHLALAPVNANQASCEVYFHHLFDPQLSLSSQALFANTLKAQHLSKPTLGYQGPLARSLLWQRLGLDLAYFRLAEDDFSVAATGHLPGGVAS